MDRSHGNKYFCSLRVMSHILNLCLMNLSLSVRIVGDSNWKKLKPVFTSSDHKLSNAEGCQTFFPLRLEHEYLLLQPERCGRELPLSLTPAPNVADLPLAAYRTIIRRG